MQSFNYKVCSRCGMTSKWVNVAALCPKCQGQLANAPAIAQARHEERERVDAVDGNVDQQLVRDPDPIPVDTIGRLRVKVIRRLTDYARDLLVFGSDDVMRQAFSVIAEVATEYADSEGSPRVVTDETGKHVPEEMRALALNTCRDIEVTLPRVMHKLDDSDYVGAVEDVAFLKACAHVIDSVVDLGTI